MVAARDLKYAARVGENAFLDVLDPGPVDAHRHLILGFTRHRAGVASDAFAVIDYEAVFHPRGLDPKHSIILGSARNGSDGTEPACKAEKQPSLCLVIPSEARDLQFAAKCRSLASLGMTKSGAARSDNRYLQ